MIYCFSKYLDVLSVKIRQTIKKNNLLEKLNCILAISDSLILGQVKLNHI